ncbi:MAG TPA: WD40 repeat domain-containing protein, partial [Chitinophagaceae bacterium]|nr:WD40 repeat domain-containing protein [Chitinophagaceae bacterium]
KDHTARLWNVATGKTVAVLSGHTDAVHRAFFSPKGGKVVTLSVDRTVKLWDRYSGTLLYSSPVMEKPVKYAALSPDEKTLFIAQDPLAGKVFNLDNGQELYELKGYGSAVDQLLFYPDGKKMVSVAGDSVAIIRDALTGNALQVLKGHQKRITGLQYSPDFKKIITFSADNSIRLWNAATGELHSVLRGHSSEIRYSNFSADGRQLLTASSGNDYAVKVWDIYSGRLLYDLNGHTKPVILSRYSPDGKLILTTRDSSPELWETASGQLLLQTEGHTGTISTALFSPDSRRLLTASWDKTAAAWDAVTGKRLLHFTEHRDAVNTAGFSPDGKKVVSASLDKNVRVWDAASGALLVKCHNSKRLSAIAFSPNGKTIAGLSVNDTLQLWDATTGALLGERFIRDKPAEHLVNYRNELHFTPDGQFIITGRGHPSIRVWNAVTLEKLYDFKGDLSEAEVIAVAPDSKKIAGYFQKGLLMTWDLSSGKQLTEPVYPQDEISALAFSPDSRLLAIAYGTGTIETRDAENGRVQAVMRGHTDFTGSLQFSPDGKKLLSSSDDNTCKRWSTVTGKEICSFFMVDSSDYFIQLPSQYYFSTTAAAKLLHYVTPDLRVISFEQLDVKYNRPDLVLQAIGNTDTALIKSYRKAWEKRIKKLGIDTTQFRDGYSVPECDFADRDKIEYEQKNGKLSLRIKGNDSTYKLDRFNVWVNESPLYGQRGINIRRKNSNKLDTVVTIKLSQGENRIETSITNVNGTESYRMPLYVNYTPAVKQKEMTRFIGIGIDQFKESRYNLQYSSKDIRDLAVKLKEKYK